MKIRKLLLGMRLWFRATTARRMYKRILSAKKKQEALYEARISSMQLEYEKKLEIERVRHRLLHTEWAGRFLQQLGRAPLMSSPAAEEYVELQYDDKEVPGDNLTLSQQALLQEYRESFINDGLNEGKSLEDIENYWERVKPRAILDVRNQSE